MHALYSSSNHPAKAAGALIDTTTAFYTHSIDALFDVGTHAAEYYADTVRSFCASATVATRQWLSPGMFDRVDPVAQYPSQGGIQQSLPIGTALASISSLELAVNRGRATR